MYCNVLLQIQLLALGYFCSEIQLLEDILIKIISGLGWSFLQQPEGSINWLAKSTSFLPSLNFGQFHKHFTQVTHSPRILCRSGDLSVGQKFVSKYPEKIIIMAILMILDYRSSSVINICSNSQFYYRCHYLFSATSLPLSLCISPLSCPLPTTFHWLFKPAVSNNHHHWMNKFCKDLFSFLKALIQKYYIIWLKVKLDLMNSFRLSVLIYL